MSIPLVAIKHSSLVYKDIPNKDSNFSRKTPEYNLNHKYEIPFIFPQAIL